MNNDEQVKLRGLAEAATPGPWFMTCPKPWLMTCPRTDCACGRVEAECGEIVATTTSDSYDGGNPQMVRSDAAFIAAANPLAIVTLLDDLARDRAEIERLREALRFYGERDFYEHPCDPSCCEGLLSRIEEDGFGDRARAALATPTEDKST